jgi:hypothetical protein
LAPFTKDDDMRVHVTAIRRQRLRRGSIIAGVSGSMSRRASSAPTFPAV